MIAIVVPEVKILSANGLVARGNATSHHLPHRGGGLVVSSKGKPK